MYFPLFYLSQLFDWWYLRFIFKGILKLSLSPDIFCLVIFIMIKPNWFDRGKWAFETNKIFALDQSLPSFQGETNMFSASLSIASFDKKSGRGYHWTMFPGRLIHCKSSESRICICNWSENNNLSGFFSHVFLFSWSMLLKYILQEGTYSGNFVWQRHDNFVVIFYMY